MTALRTTLSALQYPPWLFTLLVIALSGSVAFLLDAWFLPQLGTLLLLLLGVIIVALFTNRLNAIIASLLGALVFNVLFTEPRYSVHMTEIEDIVNMLVFLIIGVVTGQLATYYREQQQALKQAQLRSSILLSVSHDLRTPLSTIIGSLSSIQSYGDNLSKAEYEELLSGALEESHRLHRYIENLLKATKLQQGQMKLFTSSQSVLPVVEAVKVRFNNPRISIHSAPDLPEAEIQSSLLEQALYNLVDNALKYSPEGTPVQIRINSDANTLQIQVCDQGPGIPLAKLSHLFELFSSSRQGDSGIGGTGLGLAVAAGIVAAHKGKIEHIPSQQGCVMAISLPVSQQEESA